MLSDALLCMLCRCACCCSGDPASTGPPFSNFFSSCDTFIDSVATPLDAARRAHAPHTELVMNEFVPVSEQFWLLNIL